MAISCCGGLSGEPGPQPAGDWGPIQYLVGDWTGEGSGAPGQGTGWFSFKPDLQGKILVRKNHAEYPATKERPAYVHDDLMVVFRGSRGWDADYYDSERHVIRYAVESSPDGSQIVFTSPAEQQDSPRYRLTYTRIGDQRLKIKFEIAPPGRPESFTTYIEAAARRSAK